MDGMRRCPSTLEETVCAPVRSGDGPRSPWDSDISVVRFSVCHIVVGPELLTCCGFPAATGKNRGSVDSKSDTIVASSGGFDVLVANRPWLRHAESGQSSQKQAQNSQSRPLASDGAIGVGFAPRSIC
jgi:hypothetical protein